MFFRIYHKHLWSYVVHMIKIVRGSCAWCLPCAWAFLIFVLSSIPHLSTNGQFTFTLSDKFAHLLAFMPLGFFIYSAQQEWPLVDRRFSFKLTMVFGLLYGLSDEIHQIFVPGRYFDIFDFIADGIGVYLGAVSFVLLNKYSRQLVKITTHE
ncbi:MAG: VanZ family protein [Calditrichaeota bacterium]|nr:MAG: VanZ family protein [Calditrichota bacterium]